MAEWDKVVRGLECCIAYDYKCNDCPYQDDGGAEGGCYSDELKTDALALLREQEPVAPVLQSGGNYVCGNCGMYTVGYMHPLTGESVATWKYCPACGRKVRWE